MRKIKDIISKPSEALEAMVAGLLKQSQRADFIINMSTFGSENTHDKRKCFGCAATCTIQQLAGKDLTPANISSEIKRADALDFDYEDMESFEMAIESARHGGMWRLFKYFNMDCPEDLEEAGFNLNTSDWDRQIDDVRKFIDVLKREGY